MFMHCAGLRTSRVDKTYLGEAQHHLWNPGEY